VAPSVLGKSVLLKYPLYDMHLLLQLLLHEINISYSGSRWMSIHF